MTKRIILIFVSVFLLVSTKVKADEGMWLPFLVHKLNMSAMKKMGLKLTADQIYNINKGSLKDAIVALDRGSCTAELISAQGLLLTNHHCGYGEIQSHSSVEHDYLTDGFWAYSKKEELPNPGKTVSFLIRIDDVTTKVNAVVNDKMTESERSNAIKTISAKLEKEAVGTTHYEARVQKFFKGNEHYLFVYEVYRDVRLVGAPPSSIGKFGSDTDNWMWPRHTGDFSLFRVYTGPDGKPADYSPNNIPLKSKHFLPISIKPKKDGDFAMVFGYPGRTRRYLNSWGVKQLIDNENKIRIKVRGEKQRLMKADMDASDKIRIQYSSKYYRSTNYYKYSIGQNKGLKELKVLKRKKKLEKKLGKWIKKNKERKAKYGEALALIENAYKENETYNKIMNYWFEGLYGGTEVISYAFGGRRFVGLLKSGNKEMIDAAMKKAKKDSDKYFKNYNAPTDKKIFVAMMKMYSKNVPKEFQLPVVADINDKFGGDYNKFADEIFSKSIFTDKGRFDAFLKNPKVETIENDWAYTTSVSAILVYRGLQAKLEPLNVKLRKGTRLFMAALREMKKDKTFYPNANSTMRLTYGTVGSYKANGISYKSYTTLKGYMKKENPKSEEFVVPKKLKDLYNKKDYGEYGENGSMIVCFTTNNDITGGNSGSPVINGEGHLIGCAFDGNWEAMSGDIAFEPKLQKCINVDIRFVLFIIDKYAGAKNLIQEMKIIK